VGKKVFALGMAAFLLTFVLAGCGNEDCPGGGLCQVVFDGIWDGGDDDSIGVTSGHSCGSFSCATHNPQDFGPSFGEVITCDCGWVDLTRGASGRSQRRCCRL